MKKKLGALLGTVALSAGIALSGVAPAQAAGTSGVIINCTPNLIGKYGWVATYVGGKNNTKYTVNAMVTTENLDGGGVGGDFGWQYAGTLTTGNVGIGTSNTHYGGNGKLARITVKVKVNGAISSKTRVC